MLFVLLHSSAVTPCIETKIPKGFSSAITSSPKYNSFYNFRFEDFILSVISVSVVCTQAQLHVSVYRVALPYCRHVVAKGDLWSQQ